MFNASDLLGGLLQGGGPRGHATGRLEHAMGQGGGGGGGLGQILGGLGGGSGGGAGYQGGAGGGGILGSLAGMLGGGSRGGMGGGLGGMLGGGTRGGMGGGLGGMGGGNMRGAIGAGGLALLGTLAMNALRNRQQPTASAPAGGMGSAPSGGAALDADARPPEQTLTEDTARLVLRAMIDAAKADGKVDATERQRIVAKAQEGGEDPEAAAFLEQELERPADPDGLAAEARDPVVAAQVYAASLLAIQVDTQQERAYLRSFAGKLGLEPAVVTQLHNALGVPQAA